MADSQTTSLDRLKTLGFYLAVFVLMPVMIAAAQWAVRKLGGDPASVNPPPVINVFPAGTPPPVRDVRPLALPDGVYRIPPGEMVPQALEMLSAKAAEKTCWGVANSGIMEVWSRASGKGMVVAVIDTGCDVSHPDLKDAIVDAKDFTGSPYGVDDRVGHGTHTAGTIAARKNGVGIIGWAPDCSLMVLKALGDNGAGNDGWIAAAIDYAVEKKADVISMSLGSSQPSEAIRAACKRADDAGVILVAAAGNDGPRPDTVNYPGGFDECICVAAVDCNLKVADFSSRGNKVFIASPGVDIVSDFPGSKLGTMSGTSMATPGVAGMAAVWRGWRKSQNLSCGRKEFADAMSSTAKDLDPPGRDVATGYGFLQPLKMVTAGAAIPPMPHAPKDIIQIDTENRNIMAPPGWRLTEFRPPVKK